MTDIEIDKRVYAGVKLHVFPDLCADIILGQDWQTKHESVTVRYGGKRPVKIYNLMLHPHTTFPYYNWLNFFTIFKQFLV